MADQSVTTTLPESREDIDRLDFSRTNCGRSGLRTRFFTVAMAKMVGDTGRVIAVDLQTEMLEMARRNAERAGLQSRIRFHQSQPDSIGVIEPADFAIAVWMVHEVPNAEGFLGQVRAFLKPGGRFLLIEPKVHVSAVDFQKTVDLASAVGLKPTSSPKIGISRAMLFSRE